MNGLELGADHAIGGFVNHHEVLSTGGRDGRCHQPAADRELIEARKSDNFEDVEG